MHIAKCKIGGTIAIVTLIVLPLLSSSQQAWGQVYEGALTLNPLPSNAIEGDAIIFSGQLTAGNGQYVVPGRTIYIKDDVSFGIDTIIGSIITDDSGEYAGSWVAQPREAGGSYDFYAVFEGDAYVTYARSNTYSTYVESSGNAEQSSQPTSQYYPTKIILDPLPFSVYAGDSIIFMGTLTSNGNPVSNARIKILEDDPLLPDQLLASGQTDSKGRFNISWQVSKGSVETDFDIYATFDGDSNYEYARSANQIVSVLRFSGSITLDPLPRSANVGDVLVFTGRLELNQGSPEGAIVYIKDEDPLTADDLLATAYVNGDGRFSANWYVAEVDADGEADIYAVFEGNDRYYRLTTCDPNPTMDYGGSCEFTIPLPIYYSSQHAPEPATTYSDDQYMDLFYSLDFSDKPLIAIVPNPDSYNTAYRYIGVTKEGILMWTSYMSDRYAGNWDVEFEVITRDDLFFSSKPDVIVNLVTPEQESGCNSDFSGYARISAYPVKPVQTVVCVESNGIARSTVDVSATAAHEFIHAVGLGHTWNVRGDLMCSAENIQGSLVYTCPNAWLGKSKSPSVLNIAAVAALYGEDGYINPNGKVSFKQKFTMGTDANLFQTTTDDQQSEDFQMTFTTFRLEDTTGMPLQGHVNAGEQVVIAFRATNSGEDSQPYVAIVQMSDVLGNTDFIVWTVGTASPRGITGNGFSWTPETAGSYTAKAYLWSSLSSPIPLSEPVQLAITVAR